MKKNASWSFSFYIFFLFWGELEGKMDSALGPHFGFLAQRSALRSETWHEASQRHAEGEKRPVSFFLSVRYGRPREKVAITILNIRYQWGRKHEKQLNLLVFRCGLARCPTKFQYSAHIYQSWAGEWPKYTVANFCRAASYTAYYLFSPQFLELHPGIWYWQKLGNDRKKNICRSIDDLHLFMGQRRSLLWRFK